MTIKSFASYLLLACAASTAFASPTPAKYELKVSIFTTKPTPGSGGKAGTGKADIQEGESFTGADFTYQCPISFMAYGLDRPYPAFWKEKGKVLTLRVTKIADPDVRSECDLQITPQPALYAEKGGIITTVSKSEFHKMYKEIEKHEEETQTRGQSMPLRVSIVESEWKAMNSLRSGSGKGNVIEKGRTSGFIFTAQCSAMSLQKTSSTDYVGRWGDKRKTKLIMAAPAPGDAETPACGLEVTPQSVVYVKDAEGKLTQVPLAEYNKSNAKKSATKK